MGGEWHRLRIKDMADVIGGSTPSTKNPANFGGDIPWITPRDLSSYKSRYISQGERSITKQGLLSSSLRILPKKSVLLSTRAPVGYLAIASNELTTNQGFRNLVAKNDFSPEFIYYLLCNDVERLKSFAVGSTFQELSGSVLKNLEYIVPDFPEQQVIADILGALDDKIELNRRMNGTLEEMARAIFKSWFVDFDPVRAKAVGKPTGLALHIADLFPDSFEDSELGEIPKGWNIIPLPEIIEINPKRYIRKGEIAPYLDMSNMPIQGSSPISWVMREVGSGMKFMNGDTLVARITPCLENGKTAFVDFLPEGMVGWGSTEYIVLRTSGSIPPVFAYLLARTDDFRAFAIQQMTGSSGRQRISADSLCKYLMPTPEIDSPIFKHFGQLVSPLFERISAGMSQSHTLTDIRDSLLPKLISGEIRVEADYKNDIDT